MIGGAKDMIAGCIDRMRTEGCEGCDRRDACAELFSGLFGRDLPAMRWSRPRPRPRASGRNLFLSVLGEVAKAVERNLEERRKAAPADPPASRQAPAAAPKPHGDAFRREVERHLEPLLATGAIRIETVARALGLSRQTLYRRLKAEGVTFEEVLDGLRRRLALRFLREEGMAVKEAAWRLGFSDPAAFSRAFKRWTGASPTAGRRRD